MFILLGKYFPRQIYSYDFCILKLNNLKVIHDLYFQCLTQTLSKTTFFSGMEGIATDCDPIRLYHWAVCPEVS